VFVPYATLTFGAKAETQGEEPILSNEQPSNASIDNDMYPLLQITVNEPQSQNFNISWSTNSNRKPGFIITQLVQMEHIVNEQHLQMRVIQHIGGQYK